jgi:hypothetical protein
MNKAFLSNRLCMRYVKWGEVDHFFTEGNCLLGCCTQVGTICGCTCSLTEVYRRFRGACYLHHHLSKHLWNVRYVYQTTRCNNPEDSQLHTRHYENKKSYHFFHSFGVFLTCNFAPKFIFDLRNDVVSSLDYNIMCYSHSMIVVEWEDE